MDNFEYPRLDLDICFFRAYEDGKPVQPKHWFKWSKTGPLENDLVFVTGHPGSTNRLDTLAKLQHRRDRTLPYVLNLLRTQEALLLQFSARGPEQARMAQGDLYRVANARKAYTGQYQGLLDPAILKSKQHAEESFLRQLREQDAPAWKVCAGAFERITGTNVFVVSGGQLLTPPLSAGCLAGVTRALVIEWSGAVEQDLPLSALAEAYEAFLTGTTRDVQPIRFVDGQALPAAPGSVTAKAAEVFAMRAAESSDPQ